MEDRQCSNCQQTIQHNGFAVHVASCRRGPPPNSTENGRLKWICGHHNCPGGRKGDHTFETLTKRNGHYKRMHKNKGPRELADAVAPSLGRSSRASLSAAGSPVVGESGRAAQVQTGRDMGQDGSPLALRSTSSAHLSDAAMRPEAEDKRRECRSCHRMFPLQTHRAHQRSCEQGKKPYWKDFADGRRLVWPCGVEGCARFFESLAGRVAHQNACERGVPSCGNCFEAFPGYGPKALRRHEVSCRAGGRTVTELQDGPTPTRTFWPCDEPECSERSDSLRKRIKHLHTAHPKKWQQVKAGLNPRPASSATGSKTRQSSPGQGGQSMQIPSGTRTTEPSAAGKGKGRAVEERGRSGSPLRDSRPALGEEMGQRQRQASWSSRSRSRSRSPAFSIGSLFGGSQAGSTGAGMWSASPSPSWGANLPHSPMDRPQSLSSRQGSPMTLRNLEQLFDDQEAASPRSSRSASASRPGVSNARLAASASRTPPPLRQPAITAASQAASRSQARPQQSAISGRSMSTPTPPRQPSLTRVSPAPRPPAAAGPLGAMRPRPGSSGSSAGSVGSVKGHETKRARRG